MTTKVWLAGYAYYEDWDIFGVFSTEEKGWRACFKHFNDEWKKHHRLGHDFNLKTQKWDRYRRGYDGKPFKWGYTSQYKRYFVNEKEIDKEYIYL